MGNVKKLSDTGEPKLETLQWAADQAATHILRHTNGTLPLLVPEVRLEEVQVNHGHSSRRQSESYAKVRAIVENKVPHTVAKLLAGYLGENSRTLSRTLTNPASMLKSEVRVRTTQHRSVRWRDGDG